MGQSRRPRVVEGVEGAEGGGSVVEEVEVDWRTNLAALLGALSRVVFPRIPLLRAETGRFLLIPSAILRGISA